MNQMVLPTHFTSPTTGRMGWDETLGKMIKFMGEDPAASYEVIIGTDSQAQNGSADYVSALIVHKRGNGGVYFWARQTIDNIHSLKQRIWQEALISLQLAEKMVSDFKALGLTELDMEIHVDVGPNGPTRELIAEIVGMIRANGFKVATKPSSWGASHVADRHV